MPKRPTVNFKPEAWVAIGELKEHPKNPRVDLLERPEKFESLKASIEEGVFEPIKVSKLSGYCLAGNQRIKAFRELGDEEVPVMFNDCKDEKEEVTVIVKDNNEWGAYDYSMLEGLLNDFDLEIETLGFNDIDLESLEVNKKSERDAKEDVVPDIPAEPKAMLGEIYQLGRHRLMCGDSTSVEQVEALMAGMKADMVFTDPPYNVNYSGKGKKTSNTIENDHMSTEDFNKFLFDVFDAYRVAVKRSAPFYVCHSSSSQRSFEDAMELVGLKVKCQIIWNKTIASMGWGDYRWKHEPIFYATFEGKKTEFYGDRCQYTVWDESWDLEKIRQNLEKIAQKQEKGGSTVWRLGRDHDYVHPTQKPIELLEIAINNSSKEEDLILDLFGGSGSTLIGAEKTNRTAFLMELDPKYVDVIIERWEDYTGEKAEKIN